MMKINGINISDMKAKLLSRNILPASKNVTYEFLNGTVLNPVKTSETAYQYKTIDMVITVNAGSKMELEKIKGEIKALLLECSIKFDDMELTYSGFLSGEVKVDSITNTIENLSVQILALSHGEEESQTITGSSSISMIGTCETPCIVTITPLINVISYQIEGLSRDRITKREEVIVVNNLSSGIPVVIDGEKSIVTENGANKFADCEIWSFPSLLSGNNDLTLSSEQCVVQITYKPRFI